MAQILRRLICLIAGVAGGVNLAYAHDAAEFGNHAIDTQQNWALAAGAILCMAMGTGAWRLIRRWSSRPGPNRRSRSEIVLILATLAILLWMLPWLGFHGTHHALQGGHHSAAQLDSDCPVAKIAHSQSGTLTAAPATPIVAVAASQYTYTLPRVVAVTRLTEQARAPPA